MINAANRSLNLELIRSAKDETGGSNFRVHSAQMFAFNLIGLYLTKDQYDPEQFKKLVDYWLAFLIIVDDSLDWDKVYDENRNPVIINLAIPIHCYKRMEAQA